MATEIETPDGGGIGSVSSVWTASVGRAKELRTLDTCVANLVDGHGGLAAVTGPQGIGKSHLLNQFAKSSALSAVTTVKAGPDPSISRPYGAWRRGLGDLVEQGFSPQSYLTATYTTVLWRLVTGNQSGQAAAQTLPELPAEQARYRVYDAVREFLISVAKARPVVMLFDDLHRADESSLTLLRHLLPFIPSVPVLIVIAFDDEDPSWSEISRLHAAIPDDLAFEHLVLGGLEHDAVRELLSGASKGTATACSRELAGLTRGNPLHVQLLCQLIRGPVSERNAECANRLLRDLRLVTTSARQTLVHIVSTRMSGEERRILEAATMFPAQFSPGDVASVSCISETEVNSILERCMAESLITSVGSGAGLYCFRHKLFRRVLQERISPGRMVSLMRKAIDCRSGTDDEAVMTMYIADWSRANIPLDAAEKGVRHCLSAAKESDFLGAPELKRASLGRAVSLLDVGTGLDLDILIDDALVAAEIGAFEDASRSVRKVLDIFDARDGGEDTVLDMLVSTATELHDRGAGEDIWGPLRDRALEGLGEVRDCRWARLQLLEGGGMRQVSGPPLHAGKWTGLDPEAVDVARSKGGEADYCRTLFVYDWYGIDDVNDLLERARCWESRANFARALSVACETLMYRHGEFDRACRLLEEQFELHAENGSIVEQAKSLVRLTMAQLAAGDLEAAIRTRERARDMVNRLGPGYLIYEHAGTTKGGDLYPHISMESNFAWYFEGDWQAVGEHWVRAINLVEPGGSPVHIVEAAMAAQAFARLDRFEDARRYLDELTVVLRKLAPRDWAFNGAVGRASHAIWDMAAVEYAKEYHGFASHLISNGVGNWTNTSLEQTVARMAALLGRHDEAVFFFAAARSGLKAEDQDPRRAIIDFDEAVAMRLLQAPDGDRRKALLQQSLGAFERHRMNGWVQRAVGELRNS